MAQQIALEEARHIVVRRHLRRQPGDNLFLFCSFETGKFGLATQEIPNKMKQVSGRLLGVQCQKVREGMCELLVSVHVSPRISLAMRQRLRLAHCDRYELG